MTPSERAALVYLTEDCPRPFHEDVALHLLNGYVHSTPDYFVMARPVPSAAPMEAIRNPECYWDNEQCDAWWIYLAAGDLSKALGLFPFTTKLIGWERKNVPRFYPFARGIALLQRSVSVK